MTHDLNARAVDAARNSFTLNDAIGEAIGHEVVADLKAAIATFVRIAINQQSLDARADMADWELTELIFQAPVMGWDAESDDSGEADRD